MKCLWMLAALALAWTTAAQPQEAPQHGKTLAALNSLRANGCGGQTGQLGGLAENPRASRAAKYLADGNPLDEALRLAGYRANLALMVHLGGYDASQAMAVQLPAAYCSDLLKPRFTEAGVYQNAQDLWLVLADPFSAPAANDAPQVAQQVLALVNQARTSSRRCGSRLWRAAPPLRFNALLALAAQHHARDMARNNYFAHEAPDGSQASERATRAGYAWRKVGENIAAGQGSAQEAVASWLKSPRHCDNIMDPAYTDMGAAFALARAADQGIYWAQVFGAPR